MKLTLCIESGANMSGIPKSAVFIRPFLLIAFSWFYSSIFAGGVAQTLALKTDTSLFKKIRLSAEYHVLRSTHRNNFKGFSITATRPASEKFWLGGGVEISTAHHHFDNGWELTRLRFIPVYVSSKWILSDHKRAITAANAAAGLTFASYTKYDPLGPPKPYGVHETGLYLYGGFEYIYKINPFLQPLVAVGYKGFHHSLNNLDVNPHGMTLRLGFLF